jgi:acyl-CoA reductase-like NAD-dependent aldehyde dehydrogenase
MSTQDGSMVSGGGADGVSFGVASSLYTPTDSIAPMVAELRASFAEGAHMRPLEARRTNIEAVLRVMVENEDALCDAVHADLHRHRSFTRKIIGGCRAAANIALANLEAWAAERPHDATNGATRCSVRPQPFGVVLVIGTWNFPNPLVLKPLISALAAGNAVVVKLSEVCGAVSTLMGTLLAAALPSTAVRIVQGGVPVSTALLRERWGMIFYTGNTMVGRIVLRAAAEHITPCVVELGGKNPVIVAADADLAVAARKIVDGRFKNAGQFCVAPDHVLCVGEAATALLLKYIAAAVTEFFGDDPRASASYGRIVNPRHAARVASMLQDEHGGDIVCGGVPSDAATLAADLAQCYVAPTVVANPALDSKLAMDEIFGPVRAFVACHSP